MALATVTWFTLTFGHQSIAVALALTNVERKAKIVRLEADAGLNHAE